MLCLAPTSTANRSHKLSINSSYLSTYVIYILYIYIIKRYHVSCLSPGLNGGNSKDVLRYLTLLASEAPIADSGSSGANAKPDPRSGTVRVLTTGDGGVPMLQPTTTITIPAPPSKVAGRTVDILLLNCGLHDIKCMSSSDTIAMGAAAAEDTAAAAAAAAAMRAGGRKHDGVTPNVSLAEYCSNLRAAINTARESLITPAAVGVVWVKTSPVVDAIHNSTEKETTYTHARTHARARVLVNVAAWI